VFSVKSLELYGDNSALQQFGATAFYIYGSALIYQIMWCARKWVYLT